MIRSVDRHSYGAAVVHAAGEILVIFTAPWCAPCVALHPILDEIARERQARLSLVTVDTDQDVELATELRVAHLPTMIFMRDGAEIGRLVQDTGTRGKAAIDSWLDTMSASTPNQSVLDFGRPAA